MIIHEKIHKNYFPTQKHHFKGLVDITISQSERHRISIQPEGKRGGGLSFELNLTDPCRT